MNQIIMQKLAMFIFRTTRTQYENLNDEILKRKLHIEDSVLNDLINTLYNEHVIRYKYTFQCPYCKNLNTVYEGKKTEEFCQFCGKLLNICSLKNGATIRYVLDKNDFEEYMEENFKKELLAAKEGKKLDLLKDNESEKIMKKEDKEPRLFISHSSKDKEYVEALVELLEDIGMTEKDMFCSSVDGYAIPWGKDIYEYLKGEFNDSEKSLLVLFVLSDNYYKSPACLNEMGAAWILKKQYRSILLPGFDYKQIEGAINAQQKGIKLDDTNLNMQLNDIKSQFKEIFGLDVLSESKWDRIRSDFMKKIDNIKKKK